MREQGKAGVALVAAVIAFAAGGCGGDEKDASTTAATAPKPVTLDEVRKVGDDYLKAAALFATDMSGCSKIANSGDLSGLQECSRAAGPPLEEAEQSAIASYAALAPRAEGECATKLGTAEATVTAITDLLRPIAEAGRAVDAEGIRERLDAFNDGFDKVAMPLVALTEACA